MWENGAGEIGGVAKHLKSAIAKTGKIYFCGVKPGERIKPRVCICLTFKEMRCFASFTKLKASGKEGK